MDPAFQIMLKALRMAQPVVETALERLVVDPGRPNADLRLLGATCGALKDDANALVAMLIARDTDEDRVTEAEVLFRYFEQVEAQIAAIIETTA